MAYICPGRLSFSQFIILLSQGKGQLPMTNTFQQKFIPTFWWTGFCYTPFTIKGSGSCNAMAPVAIFRAQFYNPGWSLCGDPGDHIVIPGGKTFTKERM